MQLHSRLVSKQLWCISLTLLLQQALETIGCADKLVELGIKAESMNVWDRQAPILTLSIHDQLLSYTKYSYILLLSQSKTEEVLEEHLNGLGIHVQRPYKAVGIQGDADEFGNTQVSFESGEVIKAQYVIGADGARSAVSIITLQRLILTHYYHRFASCPA